MALLAPAVLSLAKSIVFPARHSRPGERPGASGAYRDQSLGGGDPSFARRPPIRKDNFQSLLNARKSAILHP
jgi:hypothetical protein